MIAVVIPWRDGGCQYRRANAAYVIDYYRALDIGPVIATDDGKRDGPFNRSAAYNLGYAQVPAGIDAVLWNEADTLIPRAHVTAAALLATSAPGLVIPFTERHELDQPTTARILTEGLDPFTQPAALVMPDRTSIGQAGVTSRATMDLIGGRWDEHYSSWGFDDNGMHHVFWHCAAPARWIDGPGMHLWHPHATTTATAEQTYATKANADRWERMRHITDPDELRREIQ
jgi:hypothetical protein